MARGKLIVIDGGDGAGKQTQARLLVEQLTKDGYTVEKLDFPQYKNNTFGALIRECLDGKHGDFMKIDPRIASTLYAADRFESKEVIEGWLAEGKIVVLDRYASSNMLHQGSKVSDDGELKELLSWLEHVEYEIFGIPRPDLNIYLHVDPEARRALIENATDRDEDRPDLAELDMEHQINTDNAAKKIVAMEPGWSAVECMDGESMRTREDIHKEVYQIVNEKLTI